MFQSVQRRSSSLSAITLDIAPLIDVVFILLIFFLVSTSFLRDTGIDVSRPEATNSRSLESSSLRIAIAESGQAYADGRPVELDEGRQLVGEFLGQKSDGTVILIPDSELRSGRLVEVMDAAKGAGAHDVAIATTGREGSR